MAYLPPRRLPDGRAMLNVGCGARFHPEWTNVDLTSSSSQVIVYDITRALPFADNMFDVVYHSHVIEHLDRRAGLRLMQECRRVVKPGGVVRVVAPDLEHSCRLYLNSLEAVLTSHPDKSDLAAEHYEWALLNLIDQMVRTRSGGEMLPFFRRQDLVDFDFVINNGGGSVAREVRQQRQQSAAMTRGPFLRRLLPGLLHRWRQLRKPSTAETEARFRAKGEVHRWMYDQYSMTQLFNTVGLARIRNLSAHESQIADWESFYLDVNEDGSLHKPGSLFVEGVKV